MNADGVLGSRLDPHIQGPGRTRLGVERDGERSDNQEPNIASEKARNRIEKNAGFTNLPPREPVELLASFQASTRRLSGGIEAQK